MKKVEPMPEITDKCSEYRREMILLGLRNKLADPQLKDQERTCIKDEIKRLEIEIGMD